MSACEQNGSDSRRFDISSSIMLVSMMYGFDLARAIGNLHSARTTLEVSMLLVGCFFLMAAASALFFKLISVLAAKLPSQAEFLPSALLLSYFLLPVNNGSLVSIADSKQFTGFWQLLSMTFTFSAGVIISHLMVPDGQEAVARAWFASLRCSIAAAALHLLLASSNFLAIGSYGMKSSSYLNAIAIEEVNGALGRLGLSLALAVISHRTRL